MKNIILCLFISILFAGSCYGLDKNQIAGTYTGKGYVVNITHKGGNDYYVTMKNTKDKNCQFEGNAKLITSSGLTLESEDPIFNVDIQKSGKISVNIPRVTDPGMCFTWEDLSKKK